MNKFLELSFKNHVLGGNLALDYEKCFEPLVEFVKERLSEKVSDEFEELCMDCTTEALWIAGVMGMELAIGVINGTIEQEVG